MKEFDSIYTDDTCYESEMRYPTDTKQLWEGIEKSYGIMCTLSAKPEMHRPRTKLTEIL